jgi:hypothetical protein
LNTRSLPKIRPFGRGRGLPSKNSPSSAKRRTGSIASRAEGNYGLPGLRTGGASKKSPLRRDEASIREAETATRLVASNRPPCNNATPALLRAVSSHRTQKTRCHHGRHRRQCLERGVRVYRRGEGFDVKVSRNRTPSSYAARFDPGAFSRHSLRTGFLTSAVAHGASLFKMMDVSPAAVGRHAARLCARRRCLPGATTALGRAGREQRSLNLQALRAGSAAREDEQIRAWFHERRRPPRGATQRASAAVAFGSSASRGNL